jgi:hypothetical protein
LIETAREIPSRPQPKASSRGRINTEGADRKPAVAIKVRKVNPAIHHAGCTPRNGKRDFLLSLFNVATMASYSVSVKLSNDFELNFSELK